MKFIVYGKSGCKSCDEAVALLTTKGLDFEYKSFGKDYDLTKFAELNKAHKSFPLISYIPKYDGVEMHEQYLGGINSLQQYLNGDKL